MFNEEEYFLAMRLLRKMNQGELTLQEYRQLQHFLINNEEIFKINYPLVKTSISGDKIMYISDTHIGGYEDLASLEVAYNIALRENIKTVVHAGDLIEACANNQFDKSKEIVKGEIEKALYYMPEELTTKLLLGNHDYSAIRTYPDVVPLFFNSPKLEILGMQRVLLNWDDIATIKLIHPISQLKYKEDTEDAEATIQLFGHYHQFNYECQERKLFIPAICKDNIQITSDALADRGMTFTFLPKPAFIISSKIDEHTILFDLHYVANGAYASKTDHEQILVDCKTKQMKKGLS